jgi:hypothetical protein
MRPTRAAWFFAAGLAWLVLRGIVGRAVPWLDADFISQRGGILLVVPMLSVLASFTAPLFFLSFLRHHDFAARPGLRAATALAAASSLTSFLLVLVSFVTISRGAGVSTPFVSSSPWVVQAVPLAFVGSLLLFLAVLSRQDDIDRRLRRIAGIAAVGTAIPTAMIIAWIVSTQIEGSLDWYPEFSLGLGAKILGLVAAASLLWFLEAFAGGYDEPES